MTTETMHNYSNTTNAGGAISGTSKAISGTSKAISGTSKAISGTSIATTTPSEASGAISTLSRVGRAFAALGMLGYALTTSVTPLDIIALLPLIAIYPMFTAIVGWDPVSYLLANADTTRYSKNMARLGLLAVSAVMILAVMLTEVSPLGGLAILALVSIFPVFIAICGENPFVALIQSHQKYVALAQSIDLRQKANQGDIVKLVVENVDSRDDLARSGSKFEHCGQDVAA